MQLKIDTQAKTLYYCGLVGLLPPIGLIIGLILIIKGINKYKNPALIFLGVLNILLTLGLLLYFNYELRYGHKYDNTIIHATKRSMWDLASKLETYKTTNGHYPDNLSQLFSYYHEREINDILQMIKSNSLNKNYNYYRKGETYILFSSGVDGKPNTQDDVYP